jgi:DNA polymerase delta subunit 2
LDGTNEEGGRDWEAARICRIVIAGNSVRDKKQIVKRTMTLRQKESSETLDAVKALDTVMLNLAKSVNVDIMPGEFDPSNYMLPQQRMHHLVFPKCAPFKSFQSVPNPYLFETAGLYQFS